MKTFKTLITDDFLRKAFHLKNFNELKTSHVVEIQFAFL